MRSYYFINSKVAVALIVAFVFYQSAFSQAPLASYKANSTTVYTYDSFANQSVDFFDQSTNTPTTWLWTFTGASPSSSTLKNPSCITYSAAGIYDVSLKVTNGSGNNTLTKSGYITVSTPPQGTYGFNDMSSGTPSVSTNASATGYPVNVYGSWFVTADTGWLVGYNGLIRETTNGTNSTPTWICQASGTGTTLMSAYAINSDICYVVGLGGTILETTDGGSTWNQLTSGTTQDLWSVWFTSAADGYISGSGGTILKTSDAGTTWRALNSKTTADLHGICFSSALKGCAVGSAGAIVKTTDSSTWNVVTSPTTNSLNAVNFRKGSASGYAVGYDGTIIETTNSAVSWTEITGANNSTLYSVQSLDGLVIGSTIYFGYFTVGDQYWTYTYGCNVCGSTYSFSGNGASYYTSWSPASVKTYFGFTGTGASGFVSPLPVSLLSFTGECKTGHTQLAWSTASEINNDFFDVERAEYSSDQKTLNYVAIGTVKGSGNSTALHNYEFTDDQPSSVNSNSGTYYYRIRQNDYDSRFSYSPEIAVNCGHNENTVTIFPNPASNDLWLSGNFSACGNEMPSLKIYTMLGKTMLMKQLEVSHDKNETGVIKIDTASLEAGTYIAEVSSGGQLQYHKLVIEK